MLDLEKIDKSWTLFLDRDGVINEEIKGEYILNREGFIFSAGVQEALKILNDLFRRILIITNQRGVGKNLMTEKSLLDVHAHMASEIAKAGGRIDHIFYCTEDDEHSFNRKPNPGMARRAVLQFPDIDLAKTIMVGNKPSDMLFGRRAGVYTVFLTTTNPEQTFPHPDIDLCFNNLLDFARAIKN
ncbi:MAG: D-glycero-alpha-D-manno-heptose-1,7-bisphosphate 7-phosphatase [Flavisolibacter sp.]